MNLWYPITAMKTAHVPVKLAGPGFEVIGEIRRHPGLSQPGRPSWWWWEIKRDGKARALSAVGLQGDFAPTLFCPLDLKAWPHGLPQPVSGAIPPSPEPSSLPTEPDDGTRGGEGWPYPGLRLGSLVPPETKQECEARLLRAIRTERSKAIKGVGNFASTYAGDIPREMADIAMRFAAYERREELRREGKPDSDTHEAVRSAWEPNRRDITDWLYCMEWMRVLVFKEFLVVVMRADDPQWTYRLIGEDKAIRLQPDAVRAMYVRAIEKAFRRARR